MKEKYKVLLKRMFPAIYLIRYEKKIQTINQLKLLPKEEYPRILKQIYKEKVGRNLNLDNPMYFTEKIQWLKLNDSSQLKANWADKLKVKSLASKVIGKEHVIPIVGGPWESFEEIDFDALPEQFVLKTNHGSGNVFVVKEKNSFLKSIEKSIAKARFDTWMKIDYGFDDGFELHYSLIKPLIFAEEYINSIEGGSMLEYRFYCFDGIPHYVDKQKRAEHHLYTRDFYDINWNKVDVTFGVGHCVQTEISDKPCDLSEMIELATKLSKGFSFVRVDFNHLSNEILLGELTFTGSSGFMKIEPEEFDLELVSFLKLPKDE